MTGALLLAGLFISGFPLFSDESLEALAFLDGMANRLFTSSCAHGILSTLYVFVSGAYTKQHSRVSSTDSMSDEISSSSDSVFPWASASTAVLVGSWLLSLKGSSRFLFADITRSSSSFTFSHCFNAPVCASLHVASLLKTSIEVL
ncbi:hypothetical protein NEAUS04_2433 [Nematocida ausubeli]|nr:hypothetical protein NEAUS04_2433 [Nematocida ausubeli]